MKSKTDRYKLVSIIIALGAGIIILIIAAWYLINTFSQITTAMVADKYHDAPAATVAVPHPLSTQIYFNNIVGQKGSLALIADQINQAQHTVEIAVYSFNSPEIKSAIFAAAKRGVKVTLVLNKSLFGQHDLFLGKLPAGITRIDDGAYDPGNSLNTYYMHDKFIITDRGYPTAKLTTGSLNFTSLGEQYNQSYLLATAEPDIISVYGKEFDLLKSGTSGEKKLATTAYNPWAATIDYSDSYLQIWFSPGTGTQSVKYRILDAINAASTSIDVMMWELTDQQIAAALVDKSKAGVKVRVIAEVKTAHSDYSAIPYLINAQNATTTKGNLKVVLDTKLASQATVALPEDFTPYIHHHMIIVDGKTLILGSENWSQWGFYDNDENTIVTNNAYLLGQSQKTFDYFISTL